MMTTWKILLRVWMLTGLIGMVTAAGSSVAQPYQPMQPDPLLEPWRWRSFPELKGLGLRSIAEDRAGHLWFGTNAGVRRYDGMQWTVYTPKDGLPGAPVYTLCATPDGSVYAGTEMGISRFHAGKWQQVFPTAGDLPWFVSHIIASADGTVWAATEWGLLHLDQAEITLYTTAEWAATLRILAPEVSLAVIPDEAALLRPWGVGIGVGVLAPPIRYLDNKQEPAVIQRLAPEGPGAAAGLQLGDRIAAVDGVPNKVEEYLDGEAGTSIRLTVQRPGQAASFEVNITRAQVAGTWRDFWINHLFEDRDGVLWLASARFQQSGGVIRYDRRAAQTNKPTAWRLYTEADGLEIGFRPAMAQTPDGILWLIFGHALKRASQFDGVRWKVVSSATLNRYPTHEAILVGTDGTLWIKTPEKNLLTYRDGAWTHYKPPELPNLLATLTTGFLEASDGALWMISLGEGAVRIDVGNDHWMTYAGLHFHDETPDGARWYIAEDKSVVRNGPSETIEQREWTWTSYGVADGLIDEPSRLFATHNGDLWATGGHEQHAAIARFDGSRWRRQTFPQLAQRTEAMYETEDGDLWFGASTPWSVGNRTGGLLRLRRAAQTETWTRYTPPDVLPTVYDIGQTADGNLWIGNASGLRRFDGKTWTTVRDPVAFTAPSIDVVYTTPQGELWIGHRAYGVFHYVPSKQGESEDTWIQYGISDGLPHNRVLGILQTAQGHVLVATLHGISGFDRRTWTTHVLPLELAYSHRQPALSQSSDGALWINRRNQGKWQTIRYIPDASPPETEITLALDTVLQPGNTTLAWTGGDRWHATPDAELQYAWRLDGGAWSTFSTVKNHIFQALPSGKHTFEVKARDLDFNEDPTPAVIRFTVTPPIWRQSWFIGLMVVLLAVVGFQTIRVLQRDRRLRKANEILEQRTARIRNQNVVLEEAVRQKEQEMEGIMERMVRHEKLAAIGQVSGSIAHELRNPLGAVKQSVYFLNRILNPGAGKVKEHLELMDHELDMADHVITELLEMTRTKPLMRENVDVRAMIEKAAQRCLSNHEIHLTIDLDPDPLLLWADPVQLQQVFVNLLTNARQAIAGRGAIAVTAAYDTAQTACRIEVRDDGCGIGPEAIEKVFEPLFTTKAKGVGLGLSICKEIVENHGGSISLQSEVGQGTRVALRWPGKNAAVTP